MAEETERAYLIVRKNKKTIDLKVILKNIEVDEEFCRAVGLKYSELRKKYHSHDIQELNAELPDFCHFYPSAAAMYIERKVEVEVNASDILRAGA